MIVFYIGLILFVISIIGLPIGGLWIILHDMRKLKKEGFFENK